ncbi:hypothetical protein K503DRAFT_380645 [Rhizopogon vinicolor AM-OR11-026]|uniref:F-box domain-containing protein n=1 Tax=Rhizopogon vinicolor AM-OR11-026 TaxID=1314800 RepID=A0A1B7MRN6_9AGAM|nr:hypothetical protein K503DRAFT_380645 [Rhizopogon vinicolor AM-OR11-026]
MHRALSVLEVLLDIFDHLHPASKCSTRPRTLAAVARTCKLFHKPAMNLLWADLLAVAGMCNEAASADIQSQS